MDIIERPKSPLMVSFVNGSVFEIYNQGDFDTGLEQADLSYVVNEIRVSRQQYETLLRSASADDYEDCEGCPECEKTGNEETLSS